MASIPSERREAIDVSLEIVEEVLNNGAGILYQHYLEQQSSEFSVKLAMQEMMEVVKWHFMGRDEGEHDIAKNPSWNPDEEPAPATIDSWARGALRIREKPVEVEPVENEAATPTTTARKKRAAARKKSVQIDEASTEAGDSQADTAVTGSGAPGTSDTSRRASKIVKGPSTADRQKRVVEESKSKRAKERATEEAQLKKMQKELKDKEYTYDRNGAVIVIDNPDGAKLPAYVVEPAVGVRTETHADKTEELRQLKSVLNASKKTSQVDESDSKLEDALRRQKQERQPAMMDTMEVGSGVTLAELGRTKAGPKRADDSNHMSREAFAGYAGSAAPQRSRAASAATAEATTPPPQAAPSPSEPTPPPADNRPNMSGMSMTALKDLPLPPKLSPAQKQQLLGARNILPRDRPNVNPNIKASQSIMPDGHSLLVQDGDQDHSPVTRQSPPPKAYEALDNTKEPMKSPSIEVNEELAKQLLGRA